MAAADNNNNKMITIILPQGRGLAVLEQLYQRGVTRAALGSARAPFTVVKRRGGIARTETYSVEKDVLNVLVSGDDADRAFAFLHEAARVAEERGAFMFQAPVAQASEFALPSAVGRD